MQLVCRQISQVKIKLFQQCCFCFLPPHLQCTITCRTLMLQSAMGAQLHSILRCSNMFCRPKARLMLACSQPTEISELLQGAYCRCGQGRRAPER